MDHFPCQINAFDVELHHKFKAASADFLTTWGQQEQSELYWAF